MKKIYLILVLSVISCLFFTDAKAQIKTGDWSIDVVPNTIVLPLSERAYISVLIP